MMQLGLSSVVSLCMQINLQPYAAGVTWLLKRALFAQKMELGFPFRINRKLACRFPSQEGIARAILQNPSAFCNLNGLVLQATIVEEWQDADFCQKGCGPGVRAGKQAQVSVSWC